MKTSPILYTANNQKIFTYEDNMSKYVAIRPICELMDIDFKNQSNKISKHYLFGSTMVQKTTVASDGKQRNMTCLPMMMAMIWVGSINADKTGNPDKVKEVQLQVLESLYNSIETPRRFMAYKEQLLKALLDKEKVAKRDFRDARTKMYGVQKEVYAASDLTIDQWLESKRQLQLEFDEEE